jgi:hypothetical protein
MGAENVFFYDFWEFCVQSLEAFIAAIGSFHEALESHKTQQQM